MSTLSNTEIVNELKTITVKEFMMSKGFVSINKKVGVNTNGYHYITFINANNEAENVYFSKSESANVSAGTEIVKGFFDNLQIAETTNADGELRTKIVGMSGNRLSVDDLF